MSVVTGRDVISNCTWSQISAADPNSQVLKPDTPTLYSTTIDTDDDYVDNTLGKKIIIKHPKAKVLYSTLLLGPSVVDSSFIQTTPRVTGAQLRLRGRIFTDPFSLSDVTYNNVESKVSAYGAFIASLTDGDVDSNGLYFGLTSSLGQSGGSLLFGVFQMLRLTQVHGFTYDTCPYSYGFVLDLASAMTTTTTNRVHQMKLDLSAFKPQLLWIKNYVVT